MKEIWIKAIVAGDTGSGKEFINRGNDASINLEKFGVSIGYKTIQPGAYRLTIMTWTMKMNRPRRDTYYEGARVALIVGNLARKGTVLGMKYWGRSIRESLGMVPLLFVGNGSHEEHPETTALLRDTAREYRGHVVFARFEDPQALQLIFRAITQIIRPQGEQLILEDEVRRNLTPVYLDTNALLMPFQFGIRLEEELNRLVGNYQIWIPEAVSRELKTLRGPHAQAAQQLAARYPVVPMGGSGDDAILEAATIKNAITVTNDSILRKRLMERGLKVIYMRELSRLDWDLG